MILAMFGYIISNVVFILNVYFFYELKAEYLLFESLQDLTGGRPVFCLAVYSYMSDITTSKVRTKRLAFLDGVFPIGYTLGNSLSGLIKSQFGFYYNFGFGILFATLAILYCCFMVKESRSVRNEGEQLNDESMCRNKGEKRLSQAMITNGGEKTLPRGCKRFFCDTLQLKNFKEGFETVLRKRPNHNRRYILLLIIAFELQVLYILGLWSSYYLYLRKALNFTYLDFSYYTTVLSVIGLASQFIVVPILSNKLRLHDTTISIMETVTSIINLLILAFVRNTWMLYIGGVIALLDNSATTMFRSLISKTVDDNEIGKVFSVVGGFQALIPFASGPIFGYIYKSTLEFQPNTFLFVLIGLKFLTLIIVSLINRFMRKENRLT